MPQYDVSITRSFLTYENTTLSIEADSPNKALVNARLAQFNLTVEWQQGDEPEPHETEWVVSDPEHDDEQLLELTEIHLNAEDAVDLATGQQRLKEIAANPEQLVTGDALEDKLADWTGEPKDLSEPGRIQTETTPVDGREKSDA